MTLRPAKNVPSTILGANIRAAREAVEWSQRELARQCHVDKSYISELESGRINDPAASFLYRVALALGTPMEDLMGVQPIRKTTKAAVVRRRSDSLRPGEA